MVVSREETIIIESRLRAGATILDVMQEFGITEYRARKIASLMRKVDAILSILLSNPDEEYRRGDFCLKLDMHHPDVTSALSELEWRGAVQARGSDGGTVYGLARGYKPPEQFKFHRDGSIEAAVAMVDAGTPIKTAAYHHGVNVKRLSKVLGDVRPRRRSYIRDTIMEHGPITMRGLMEMTGWSRQRLSGVLHQLRKAGLVDYEGRTRGRVYTHCNLPEA